MSARPVVPVCAYSHSVVKTRMQSLSAKKQYRNAFHCAYRILTEEGVLKFWKGTVPRLGRLIVSPVPHSCRNDRCSTLERVLMPSG
jgi:solute carrier family 25 citrate transporter 1